MPRPLRVEHGFGSQSALSTAASDSTRSGDTLILDRPLSHWSVTTLLTNSTSATLVLRGSASSSDGAPMGDILSITASTGGETNWSTAPFPVKQVRLDVDAQSSSGAVMAWIAGAR